MVPTRLSFSRMAQLLSSPMVCGFIGATSPCPVLVRFVPINARGADGQAENPPGGNSIGSDQAAIRVRGR